MKVTLVANDHAPSRAFSMIESELTRRGVDAKTFFSGENSGIISRISTSRLLLLGMSCTPEFAKSELFAAGEAKVANTPYGFYADLYGCIKRSWFEPYRDNAKFVFVISERESEAARKLFPKAKVFITGNPILENAFFPEKSSEETRKTLKVQNNEIVVYCTAGKNFEANKAHFYAVVKAVARFPNWRSWKVFFMLHPRDQNDPDKYRKVVETGEINSHVVTDDELKSKSLKALDVISACDVMVGGGSTSEVEAACNRKPVVTYLTPISIEQLRKQTGSDKWYLCELGVSQLVQDNVDELSSAVYSLVLGGNFQRMRERQEISFPVPKKRGEVIEKMVTALIELAN